MSTSPTDQPREAVALRYDGEGGSAPELVAKGKGEIAEAILSSARANGVPVREDADLLELLSACDLGQEIPTELYAVVAELLTYLYRLNGSLD
jgi:flagellar biosynthesis protein